MRWSDQQRIVSMDDAAIRFERDVISFVIVVANRVFVCVPSFIIGVVVVGVGVGE